MAGFIPTRDDLLERLQHLCSGQEARANVAAWAVSIIDDDSLRVSDRLVWKFIKRLGAVDLRAPDREFLYTDTDFKEWLSEFV